MNWNGKRLLTYGEIAKALYSLESAEEAQQFMKAYELENEHADQNVWYLLGYLNDIELRDRLYKWCQTVHPVVGIPI